MDYTGMFHSEIPEPLRLLAETPPMRRLANVGMNCGCEYTAFPRFSRIGYYSRLIHSEGVGRIVYHFTGDLAQAAAGLLHDIATPVFAHVIDFLHGDYLNQKSTEDDTEAIIRGSAEIGALLESFGLCPEQVCDYHLYPVADNDSPRLSADRLEYTVGNGINYGLCTAEAAAALYRDLTVAPAEDGFPELSFRTPEKALFFGRLALSCGKIYSSAEDRYAMQLLAELLSDAVSQGVLRERELWQTEPQVIAKLCASPEFSSRWQRFRAYHEVNTGGENAPAEALRVIPAKKRWIDPLIAGAGRARDVFPAFREEIAKYLAEDFSVPVWAV